MSTASPSDAVGAGASGSVQAQAWVWLRLLHSGQARVHDLDGLRRWLRAASAHQAAFDEAKQQWADFNPLSREALRADAGLAQRHAQVRATQQARSRGTPGRRAFLGMAGAGALAGLVGFGLVYPPAELWPAAGEWGADLRTATGEQRTVTLEGRVGLMLNTRTSVRLRSAGSQADGIELLAGEAAIDLRASARAFRVVAGAGRSVAEGGRFEVRHLDGRVCVSCIEGLVRIEHPAGERLLRARQQAVYVAASIGTAADIDAASVTAWHQGELVFSETPLHEVIAEINRYRPGRIVLLNTQLRDRPVTGSFFTASLDEALLQIRHGFGLQARTLVGGLVVLS